MINGSPVVDFHGHQGRWDAMGMTRGPDDLVRIMDMIGIDYACLFNIFHDNGRTGNDLTAGWTRRFPARLIGFAYIAPLSDGRAIAELERAIDDEGMRAIKIYPPLAGAAIDDTRWDTVYQFAHDRSLAIIIHTDMRPVCQPRLLVRPARRFPNARFVCAHAGNLPEARLQAIDAARRCANIYLETCTTFRSPGVIEQLVEGVGAQKVLYGSDMPVMDPRVQIGKILTARLAPADVSQILGLNAVKLLGIGGP
jgi:hypothetical protein